MRGKSGIGKVVMGNGSFQGNGGGYGKRNRRTHTHRQSFVCRLGGPQWTFLFGFPFLPPSHLKFDLLEPNIITNLPISSCLIYLSIFLNLLLNLGNDCPNSNVVPTSYSCNGVSRYPGWDFYLYSNFKLW